MNGKPWVYGIRILHLSDRVSRSFREGGVPHCFWETRSGVGKQVFYDSPRCPKKWHDLKPMPLFAGTQRCKEVEIQVDRVTGSDKYRLVRTSRLRKQIFGFWTA